ncbi:hypothetical protein Ssi03_38180 [Sphaerisporangium siamense]|uniref:Uncharacterized protein n=1 Tax=Sphaerisporangium siamense TaxID=795645 RepID=A0A7W7D674_9ACTN|nr:hypothetical protein [Sphaerisporangium siamense]MBB4701027.1 hypothetical protein [Sphaerisporangium siamense]GII85828.1 hypothetical protein Ssi03_38180 [Sphaerisporangium siamense]
MSPEEPRARPAPWPPRGRGASFGGRLSSGGGPSPYGPARPWVGSRTRAASLQATRERVELERGVRFRSLFLLIMGTLLVVAATDVLLGAVGVLHETRSRPLTPAERARYAEADVARRWHTWPADRVFPAQVAYVGLARVRQYAKRVGIAAEAPCASVVDGSVGAVLRQRGCRTMLRATYVDQTAAFVVTVGVAVLADEDTRVRAAGELPVDDRVGVRPVAFPGTVTESFGAAQRQRTGWVGAGPYIVFTTAGYADGRTREAIAREEITHSELWPTAQSIAGHIGRGLSAPPEIPRCTQGNVC